MKVGDGPKPAGAFVASRAAAGQVQRGGESPGVGKPLQAAIAGDPFEKATPPAFAALVGSGAAAASQLGSLRSSLDAAQSETRSLLGRLADQRAAGGANLGAAKRGGDLSSALVETLAAVADKLSEAQDAIAGEASLEGMIGHAGRLARGDTRRDAEALAQSLADLKTAANRGNGITKGALGVARWKAEKDAEQGRLAAGDAKQALLSVESQLQQLLRQIEGLRQAEAAEQDASPPDPPGDALAKAAGSVSDAYAAIRGLLDP